MPRVYGPKKTKDKKKNPTAGAQVAEAAQVQLPAQHSGLQLWFGFNPESRNFDMLQVWPLEKKKKGERILASFVGRPFWTKEA